MNPEMPEAQHSPTEPVLGLEKATESGGPLIVSELPPESRAQIEAAQRQPDKLDELINYLAGRSFAHDPNGWVIKTMDWALNLGMPQDVVDAAIARVVARFKKR